MKAVNSRRRYAADLVELESVVTQWHEYRVGRERGNVPRPIFSFASERRASSSIVCQILRSFRERLRHSCK